MATTRTTVKVKNDFKRVGRGYDRAIELAVAEAARVGQEVARQAAASRVRTGAMADVKMTSVRQGKRGPNALLVSTPYYAAWQNWGTRARRRKQLSDKTLKRRGHFADIGGKRVALQALKVDSGGIKPLYFMSKGRTAARKLLLALIVEHMSRVR